MPAGGGLPSAASAGRASSLLGRGHCSRQTCGWQGGPYRHDCLSERVTAPARHAAARQTGRQTPVTTAMPTAPPAQHGPDGSACGCPGSAGPRCRRLPVGSACSRAGCPGLRRREWVPRRRRALRCWEESASALAPRGRRPSGCMVVVVVVCGGEAKQVGRCSMHAEEAPPRRAQLQESQQQQQRRSPRCMGPAVGVGSRRRSLCRQRMNATQGLLQRGTFCTRHSSATNPAAAALTQGAQ